jgi:uncharacterized repeat protein (TIGR01451 family)
MRRFVLIALVLLALLTPLPLTPAALAQGGLTLFTRFPAQQVARGEDINFPLILRAPTPQVARLSVPNLPEGWTATLRGDGRVVEAAYVLPDEDTRVELRVQPAENAAPGEYRLSVVAEGNGESATLQLQITVKEQLPPSLVFDVDLPNVRGAPDSTFRFNTTLRNEGDTDLTTNLLAEVPPGWFVRFRAVGQEVTSLPVRANGSESISVEVEAPEGVELGSFPIYVKAESGDVRAEVTLTAEVVGQPQVNLTTPDGRLSGQATIGQTATYTLLVRNTGSAPARNITMSGTPPSGWTVEFQPANIAELGGGAQQEVTVNLRPADQAVAGDYVVSFSARPEEGRSSSVDFRITVLTSTLWGIVGIVLIAIAVGVVGLAVSRFGRR